MIFVGFRVRVGAGDVTCRKSKCINETEAIGAGLRPNQAIGKRCYRCDDLLAPAETAAFVGEQRR
jgi:phage FluMu protein Com